jgi:hypothetical protein
MKIREDIIGAPIRGFFCPPEVKDGRFMDSTNWATCRGCEREVLNVLLDVRGAATRALAWGTCPRSRAGAPSTPDTDEEAIGGM